MISFIIGNVIQIEEDYMIIQNNNIGYKIYSSARSLEKIELASKDILVYTNMIVREDDISLYGFINEEEIEVFKLLISVSRIGPKVALGILSSLSPNVLKTCIVKEDIKTLCKAPGVGKKTAERLILELRDKIDISEVENDELIEVDNYSAKIEAIEALVSLGYSRYEVEKELNDTSLIGAGTEDIIRYALKKLSR